MKAALFYFSGTGNTAKIASLFSKELNAELFALPLESEVDLSEFDLIGISYPVHGFQPPKPVLTFVKKMPGLKRRVFFFKTSGENLSLNDESSGQILRILKRKGYLVSHEFHYVMPYNMIFRHSDSMAKLMYQTAIERVPKDVESVLEEPEQKLKIKCLKRLFLWPVKIERPFAGIHGHLFKVNLEKCIRCQKCVRECPMKNITIDSKGEFHFRANCVLCMRCSVHCPTGAIDPGIFRGSWKIQGDYELDRLLKDDNILPKNDCEVKLLKKSYRRYFDNKAYKE